MPPGIHYQCEHVEVKTLFIVYERVIAVMPHQLPINSRALHRNCLCIMVVLEITLATHFLFFHWQILVAHLYGMNIRDPVLGISHVYCYSQLHY